MEMKFKTMPKDCCASKSYKKRKVFPNTAEGWVKLYMCVGNRTSDKYRIRPCEKRTKEVLQNMFECGYYTDYFVPNTNRVEYIFQDYVPMECAEYIYLYLYE